MHFVSAQSHFSRFAFPILLLFLTASLASAQYQDPNYAQRTHSVDQADSRAEQEADRLVSLSPDRIIDLLSTEPGLMLEVKKMLVRKAYDQGRILDPSDLDDDAIYQLVREDQNVRALVTQEIEDREYIRAKPNSREREEMQHQDMMASMQSQDQLSALQQGQNHGENQEDSYWNHHDQQDSGSGLPFMMSPTPSIPLAPRTPQQNNLPNPNAPQLNMAQAQSQSLGVDYVDMLASSGGQMPKIDPSQLPALLNASNSGALPPGLGSLPNKSGMNLPPTLSPSLNASAGPIFDIPEKNGNSNFQQQNPQSQREYRSASTSYDLPDHPFIRHRANPYADVPSLYDLYSQYSSQNVKLTRFGQSVFLNGTGNFDELPMDLPVGPDYVVGPGDGLSIDLWGSVSQRLNRVVDREGRIALPEAGAVQVSGRSLGDVQRMVQSVLRTEFRDIQADVSLAKLRSIRVYVVGDVERPGAYDVSSLSTPLNALYSAGGPTSRGSLRVIRHFRGRQLVQELDVYDLLLHGIHADVKRMEPGDTILIPPLGPEVTIEGMVRRPAIYELHGEHSLAEALQLAGGVLPTGTLREIDVDRLQAHESRAMLRLQIPETDNQEAANKVLDTFQVQDGDKIRILPILPYSNKTVYLEGHVFRPGKYAYSDGMKISDVVRSYADLLPEPSLTHAEIIRLNPPDFKPEVLAFNLSDALAGKTSDIALKPFDTIRIFSQYDFQNPPLVTVTGEVRDPGDHITNGVTHLSDAVYLAGGTTPDAELDDAQIFRKTKDGKLKVISANLREALAGDPKSNVVLLPDDRVIIHRNLARTDPQSVSIEGEVARPGKYPLGDDLTAAGLVRLAGGLRRGAYTRAADLTRYDLENGSKVVTEHVTIALNRALNGDPDTDYRLRDGDVLTIRQVTGWNDVGAVVTVRGEVLHPGTYGINEGERLSDVLARAGGFTSEAYPYGIIYERKEVRELEQKNRADLIRRVSDEGSQLKLTPETDPDARLAKEATLLQWHATLEKLQRTPPEGRQVIHISSRLKNWVHTSADIQVRDGDVIYIPKRPNFVTVDGAVFNSTAVTYRPGKSVRWYLHQAGGPTNTANHKAIFVIRADGSVVGGASGLFHGGVLDAALEPGDMVVVPEKAYGGSITWRNTLETAQLVSAVGIAVQVARGF